METTADVHLKADPEAADAGGAALVDRVLDSCGSKGTGKWTIQQAAELGVPMRSPSRTLSLDLSASGDIDGLISDLGIIGESPAAPRKPDDEFEQSVDVDGLLSELELG